MQELTRRRQLGDGPLDVDDASARDACRLSEAMVRRTLEVLVDAGQIPPAWRDRSAAEGGLWTNRLRENP
jgi:hypothetical protein